MKGDLLMSTQPDEELETIYWDYWEEADRVKKGRKDVLVRNLRGVIAGILIIIFTLFFGIPHCILWAAVFITVFNLVYALVMANNYAEKEASKSAQSRPGFTTFFKPYFNRNYWPYRMVTGEKYEKFLSLVGRKISE
jgi:hypothetical protein